MQTVYFCEDAARNMMRVMAESGVASLRDVAPITIGTTGTHTTERSIAIRTATIRIVKSPIACVMRVRSCASRRIYSIYQGWEGLHRSQSIDRVLFLTEESAIRFFRSG